MLNSVNFRLLKQILGQISFSSQIHSSRVIWIGDSHSAFIRRGIKEAERDVASMVYWLGPRLMYSISKSGFPLNSFTKLILRSWRANSIIVVLGEIDVRMFLAKNICENRKSYWIEDFLEKLDILRINLGKEKIHLIATIPPSDLPPNDTPIERVGTLQERVEACSWLYLQISKLLEESYPKIILLNLGNSISTSDGSIDPKYCLDGIHVNTEGAARIWNEVKSQILY